MLARRLRPLWLACLRSPAFLYETFLPISELQTYCSQIFNTDLRHAYRPCYVVSDEDTLTQLML